MARRSTLTYGRGNAQIRMSGTIRELVAEVLEKSLPVTLAAMEKETAALHSSAKESWPVRTGRSRRALSKGKRLVPPATVETNVRNKVKNRAGDQYAFFIRMPWPHNHRYVYRELVVKPGRKAGKRLSKVLQEEMGATAKGAR